MDDERIVELETKIAYQENSIEGLQKSLFEYHSLIEKLEKNLKTLTEKVERLTDSQEGAPLPHQKPPHY